MKTRYGLVALCFLAAGCEREPAQPPVEVADAAPSTEVAVEAPHPGEAVYLEKCGSCHDGLVYKAPHRMFLGMMAPDALLASMVDGTMVEQSKAMTEQQKRDVAEFIAGRSLDEVAVAFPPPSCGDDSPFDAARKPTSLGWGVDRRNSRFQGWSQRMSSVRQKRAQSGFDTGSAANS